MGEALKSISFRQLHEWYQYYLDEPFGWQIEELRHGQRCSAAINAPHITPKQLFSPSDFYLRPPAAAKARPPTAEEIKQKFNMG